MSIFSDSIKPDLSKSFDDANAADMIGCEYIVLDKNKSAAALTEIYLRALDEGKTEGFFPVILVSSDYLKDAVSINYDEAGGREQRTDDMKKIVLLPAEDILKRRHKEYFELDPDYEDIVMSAENLEMPDDIPAMHWFMGFSDIGEDDELLLAKVPVNKPWEIFTYIPFGGWNDCPYDSEITAVSKYWYEKFEAVPAVIHSDVIEMYVSHPVKDDKTAIELAKQQFDFCYDIVEQGVGSVGALAAALKGSEVWYFWWD